MQCGKQYSSMSSLYHSDQMHVNWKKEQDVSTDPAIKRGGVWLEGIHRGLQST